MNITQSNATDIELIVRKIFDCDRFGIGGLANSDCFRNNPLFACMLCIGKLYKNSHDKEIGVFITRWRTIFDYPDENKEHTIDEFIEDFENLIKIMKV